MARTAETSINGANLGLKLKITVNLRTNMSFFMLSKNKLNKISIGSLVVGELQAIILCTLLLNSHKQFYFRKSYTFNKIHFKAINI